MTHRDLPQRWKDKIEIYLQKKNSKYKQFSAYDFSCDSNLKITFADGSNVCFKDSFYWVDEDDKEVAIFTEHCGYHIFNLPELLIETTDWKGNIIKIENFLEQNK